MRRPALQAPAWVLVLTLTAPASAGGPSPRGAGRGELFRRSTGQAPARTLPPGFEETVAFAGLTMPTALAFAADGRVFVAEQGASYPVDLRTGPGGDLFYVDYDGGEIRRITYTG